MIKNIVFDIGKVLVYGHASLILDKTNLTEEQKIEVRKNFFNHANRDDLDLGNITIEQLFEKHTYNFEIDDMSREIIIHYYKYRKINQDILNLAKKLKDNGYNIFILSNNNLQNEEYLKSLDSFKIFENWFVSCDYKLLKPQKEIYEKFYEVFNLKPEECFFIDDKKENIEQSIITGMAGFVLNYEEEGINTLLEKLDELNINYK